MPCVIVNTSPLIALSSIDCLHVLRDLYKGIIIPDAVYAEIGAKADSKLKQEIDASVGWIKNYANQKRDG